MVNHDDEFSVTISSIPEKQTGGGNATLQPTGGFPPIYIMDKEEHDATLIKNTKKVYEKPLGTTVSIKDILQKRRYAKPFTG